MTRDREVWPFDWAPPAPHGPGEFDVAEAMRAYLALYEHLAAVWAEMMRDIERDLAAIWEGVAESVRASHAGLTDAGLIALNPAQPESVHAVHATRIRHHECGPTRRAPRTGPPPPPLGRGWRR